MNEIDLPALPPMGARGPQVCAAVRFYIAIVDDLPFEQVHVLSEHIQSCEECATEFRLLQQVTHQVAMLPVSAPSAHVDTALLAAIQNRGAAPGSSIQLYTKRRRTALTQQRTSNQRRPGSRRWSGPLALAAVLVVLILAGAFLHGLLFPSNNAQAFQIPSNLSWNGYVLHYTQTIATSNGQSYQVEVYQDLGSNQMHIESTLPGQFDVVVVTDDQSMLGEDMLHHVAEMGGNAEHWVVDGSLFNLTTLRQNLSAQQIIYLGKETYQGQQVYLVRASNGQVLLLNIHYLPITVLTNYTGPGTGTSLYKTFILMQSAQVSDTMWDMQVPSGFQMGQLPARS
jgi:hypothetical protein